VSRRDGFELFSDLSRASAAGACVVYLASLSVQLRAAVGDDLGIVESALKQGGLFALMVLVFFFYRRDWKTLTESQQATNETLIKLVNTNVAVMTEVRDELRNVVSEVRR